jgi:hypothetical protein
MKKYSQVNQYKSLVELHNNNVYKHNKFVEKLPLWGKICYYIICGCPFVGLIAFLIWGMIK